MPSDRNKIAQALSVEQLNAFIAELAALPGKDRTLEAIKARAAAMGIEISLMSAKAFRDTTFDRHLKRLAKAQELALQVAGMQEAGAGNTLADASAAMLSQSVFELLTEDGVLDDDGKLDIRNAGKLAVIIEKLRTGNVKASELELKVKAYEAREAERAEKAKAADAAMQKLRDPGSDISDSERAAIVATVDEVLGIRVKKKE